VRPLPTMILRSTGTSELTFDDMDLPANRLVGRMGDGLKTILTTLNEGRLSVAAGAVGAAQCAFDLSLKYATSRTQFGKPIGEFQLVQQHLVEQATIVRASRLLVQDAARGLDAGQPASPHFSNYLCAPLSTIALCLLIFSARRPARVFIQRGAGCLVGI
jgi:acyl-CoA dehydrogenase